MAIITCCRLLPLLVVVVCCLPTSTNAACQACFGTALLRTVSPQKAHPKQRRWLGALGVAAAAVRVRNNNPQRVYQRLRSDDQKQKDDDAAGAAVGVDNDETPDLISESAKGAIRFYKSFISPILPPACRFVPTCSQYGIQAIEEYGTQKGITMIAWRLLRCSPLGGKGYDPPKWPLVSYTYSSY